MDAGATKTAFVLLRDGVVLAEHVGEGINPNYCTDEKMSQVVEDFVRAHGASASVRHVQYYGAGCASMENAGRVGCVLQSFFHH